MKKVGIAAFLILLVSIIYVTGKTYIEEQNAEALEDDTEISEKDTELSGNEAEPSGDAGNASEPSRIKSIADESAEDADIDFAALKEENPDIFAWIYIPDTAIDYPVLQSDMSDTFYEDHNAYGEEDDTGAVYIELANLTSMCDFNTVLHGKTGTEEAGLFADLYRFASPDFFESHEYAYIYLDGNVLTYEIFAAYERENTSLIRTYDFTYLSGCQQFLNDLYGNRDMRMNLREGWENVSSYNYVITLTTQKEENADSQFVVTAVLIQDAAGTINRVVTE